MWGCENTNGWKGATGPVSTHLIYHRTIANGSIATTAAASAFAAAGRGRRIPAAAVATAANGTAAGRAFATAGLKPAAVIVGRAG